MEPTYQHGKRILVSRLFYKFQNPVRGDVIVLRHSDSHRIEIKRIVGLPMERVSLNRILSVNQIHLVEPYVRNVRTPGDDETREWLLSHGEYFVLGDNRIHSTDSRSYGPIKYSQIVGKVIDV